MEYWNVGIVEQRVLTAENINSNMIEFLLTQYSNWGEALKSDSASRSGMR